MPTDDDYSQRRERLLLHQHPGTQYGQSVPASPLRGCTSSSSSTGTQSVSGDCSYHKQQSSQSRQQQQQPISQGVLAEQHRYISSARHAPSSGNNDYRAYHQQQQLSSATEQRFQQKRPSNGSEYANVAVSVGCNPFSTENFPSPPSPAPASDAHFLPPPPLSPSVGDKYSSSQSLASCHAADRHVPASSANSRDSHGASAAPSVGSSVDQQQQQRFASTDRILAGSGVPSGETAKDQQQRYAGTCSTERLLASPVLGVLGSNYAATSLKDSSSMRYGLSSTERLLSASPIHAPAPDKFLGGGKSSGQGGGNYLKDSPVHERYAPQQHFVCGSERYSPKPNEGRYSSSERILASTTTSTSSVSEAIGRRYSTDEAACQKYTDSRASPAPAADFANRFQGYPECASMSASQRYGATTDRFNELALQRYAQSRPNDRFVHGNERHVPSSSGSAHDTKNSGGELARYTCNSSTERLLASSSSPSLNESTLSREVHHHGFTPSSSSIGTQSMGIGDQAPHFASLSPTPDGSNPSSSHIVSCHMQQSSKQSDKHHHQMAKPIQAYVSSDHRGSYDHLASNEPDRYAGLDRFSSNETRYTTTGSDRYHCTTTGRYSPARGNADKYLSLPKPKDRYNGSGRIASSCVSVSSSTSERSYASGSGTYIPPPAHTPVERYVPQPPPEVLYPDRYADRYVPPGAHTPVDRYVPVTDPNDSYVRRDLGFHNHYRGAPTSTTSTNSGAYPAYPAPQSQFRFRNSFGYQAPAGRLGSPGSSSSSSSNSVQRDGFSTSPLLRSKTRDMGATTTTPRHATPSGQSQQQSQQQQQPMCCMDATNSVGQRASCCQAVRRSMPPGALPSIPQQSGHSPWQQSPNSGTTSASSASSSTDTEPSPPSSSQTVGLYPVSSHQAQGQSQPQQQQQHSVSSPPGSSSTTPTSVPGSSAASTATCASTGGPANVARSVSAPTTSTRPQIQQQPGGSGSPSLASAASTGPGRPRLRRNQSKTEAIKNYIKKETATFFGVDEETEAIERQKWLDRRRRMASRKYGALLPEHRPPDPDITKDVPDALEVSDPVTLRKWQRPVRRKDSVARMTLSGLQYVVDTLRRQRPGESTRATSESRSFPPSATHSTTPTSIGIGATLVSQQQQVDDFVDDGAVGGDGHLEIENDEEEAFFKVPKPNVTTGQDNMGQIGLNDEQRAIDSAADALQGVSVVDGTEAAVARVWSPPIISAGDKQHGDRAVIDGQVRRHRAMPIRDHYTLRPRAEPVRAPGDVVGRASMPESSNVRTKARFGSKRIAPSTIDRVFDNSNRRLYGMGIVGRFFGRSFRKSVAHKPDIRKQLDDIEDHRPYFTYWISTVQILILIISLFSYGFGPIGFDLAHRSSLVLVTSLSLQQVEYQEPANFWIGPRAADLIHLGAKFAPCMRRDIKILKEIDVWREKERDTACCIRNDDSGCVQSSRAECSNTISTWKKWGPADSGPGGRISGSVCGLDPKFCDAPASIAPYEWPDDITKWPICRKINPLSQRFRSKEANLHGNANFPVGRYKDKMAEHMICEVIGHPCCIGIHGSCRITTKEYCDFVHGYFHEEASLCSQVECLHDVCGMMPFLNPEWPDQFYRLFTTTFLHAGILHIAITLFVQYFLMRDLEKLTGSIRIALIYFIGAVSGNLASAIFIPYRAEVGPAGAHFALLATLVVEVLHCWPMLKYPRRALSKLLMIVGGLLLLGVLPWIDNYAHLFGFIFGFLAAYALMPFISFGAYDRRRKILVIWACLALIIGLFALLLGLFYSVPMYDCEICKLFTCVPLTRDFCASQNINFKKEEPV